MPPGEGQITRLLQEWRAGSREAENELFDLVFPRLRRLAQYLMKGERAGHSMQATELVDEAYFGLIAARDRDWRNRGHFFAIAGRTMRRRLIDHARRRPDAQPVAIEGFEDVLTVEHSKMCLAVTIDGLLHELERIEPDWCTIVEVKYFLGLTDEETADALGIRLRTLQRMWSNARQWLFERLESHP